MCFAAACVCFTVKILFNITEAARLWAVDERVHMLRPILGNIHQKISRLSRVFFLFLRTCIYQQLHCAAVRCCRRTTWRCSSLSCIWSFGPPSPVFSTGPPPCRLWPSARGWTRSGSDDRCPGKTAQWFPPIGQGVGGATVNDMWNQKRNCFDHQVIKQVRFLSHPFELSQSVDGVLYGVRRDDVRVVSV